MNLLDSFEIRTNPWIPKGYIVMTDRFGEVVGVIKPPINWRAILFRNGTSHE